jgi:hypothetical protein
MKAMSVRTKIKTRITDLESYQKNFPEDRKLEGMIIGLNEALYEIDLKGKERERDLKLTTREKLIGIGYGLIPVLGLIFIYFFLVFLHILFPIW